MNRQKRTYYPDKGYAVLTDAARHLAKLVDSEGDYHVVTHYYNKIKRAIDKGVLDFKYYGKGVSLKQVSLDDVTRLFGPKDEESETTMPDDENVVKTSSVYVLQPLPEEDVVAAAAEADLAEDDDLPSVQDLISKSIRVLYEQLDSDDITIRQNAAMALLKYLGGR